MARKAKPGQQPPPPPPPQQTPRETSAPPQSAPAPATPNRPSLSFFAIIRHPAGRRTLALIILAAVASPVSQLSLTPVYGAVPAGLYHSWGRSAAALAAFMVQGETTQYLPRRFLRAVPTFAFWLPTFQFVLFKLSSRLGNPWGPVVTECMTCYPLIFLSVYAASLYTSDLSNEFLGPPDPSTPRSTMAELGPSFFIFALLKLVQRSVSSFVNSFAGPSVIQSRVGLQLLLASGFALTIPSQFLLPSLPSAAFTMLANVHTPVMRTTDVLRNTLALSGYSLLERKESYTGYISVLDNTEKGYRVMRCDHSLLGGEWQMKPEKGYHPRVNEPIYGVFTMLEAVRLVESDTGVIRSDSDSQAEALVVGLGIGTASSALVAHGIKTTTIEIDPVVVEFATKYFALPTNHTTAMGDAAAIVARTRPHPTYDYVIHDVFTGGAEPADLFTVEFLSGLAGLMKPDGVIAINYAGDVALPASSLVYRTILSVFPSCRAFREDEPTELKEADFTNMVIFCQRNPAPLRFRSPVKADFLGSGARREFLYPKHEILADKFQLQGSVLRKGRTQELQKWQAQSAVGHWRLMRTVMPDAVWENW